jgi:hypothetical protein
MPTIRIAAGLAAVAGSLALSTADAHHSYAAFDRCKSVALEGEITSVAWVNPHIVIDLKTSDTPGYRVEWFSLVNLANAGIEAQTLKTGDRVVIIGNAMRDPAMKVLSLVSEISRPSDGWSWKRGAPRGLPESCVPH